MDSRTWRGGAAPGAIGLVLALLLVVALAVLVISCGCSADTGARAQTGASARAQADTGAPAQTVALGGAALAEEDVPAYTGKASVSVNGGLPRFDEADFARGAFEEYAPLDELGRCGAAFALVGPETMPDEPRGSIGMVRPSGWHTARYDWVDGGYLYNRCHLIGYQLSGKNDDERNLITGTRSMNVEGMLPYEDRVASYLYSTGNHVLYRATPVFEGDDLVARGVLLEAQSVEDQGALTFCAWCYNVEPGVEIDYSTGESRATASSGAASASEAEDEPAASETLEVTYVLNRRSKVFHRPGCESVANMSEHNKLLWYGTREDALEKGYRPCGNCQP